MSLNASFEDVQANLSEHGFKIEHGLWGVLVLIHNLLEKVAEPDDPNKWFTLHDSRTIAAGKTTAALSFKSNANDDTWMVTRYTVESLGGNTFTCKVYSDPANAETGTPLNLVDNVSGVKISISQNEPPVFVPPGHRLTFKFSAATAADTIVVVAQGYRALPNQPHTVASVGKKKS